ncbi:MAG: hypothetical protein MPJ25_05990, partial [Pirellulales bacterium]|nr:hypothetical protein [Pirellulales bacterium]
GKGLRDFRGEGFHPGEAYKVRIVTKNISNKDGSDVHLRASSSEQKIVEDGVLLATVPGVRQFTIIDFVPVPQD